MVDPLFIKHEIIINLKGNSHWAMQNKLKFHQGFIAASIETTNIVVLRGVVVVAAALEKARRVLACVREAVLFHHTEVLDILPTNEIWKATITTLKKERKKKKKVLLALEIPLFELGDSSTEIFHHSFRYICILHHIFQILNTLQ